MSSPSTAQETSSGSLSDSATVSIAGRWVTVPALAVNGNRFVVTAKLLKLASVDGDEYLLGEELGDPAICVKEIKKRREPRVDSLTFRQKLVDSSPKYKYYVEFDSVAAVQTANFDEWWQNLPQESRKNVVKSAPEHSMKRIASTWTNTLCEF